MYLDRTSRMDIAAVLIILFHMLMHLFVLFWLLKLFLSRCDILEDVDFTVSFNSNYAV